MESKLSKKARIMINSKRIKYLIPIIVLVLIPIFIVQTSCSSKSTSTTQAIEKISVSETAKVEETTQSIQETTVAEITEIVKESKESNEEEQTTTVPDTNIFLSDKNLNDSFIGLSISEVQELQQSKGWPPAFPLNPALTEGFTVKVSIVKTYDKDNNPKDISIIIFNLPIGTEIIAPIEGWLAFGGGSFYGDGKGGNNIFIGLNNILGRVEFSYFLKEPMEPMDMDKLKPKSYGEGSVLLNIDNDNSTTDFGIVSTQEPGNLVMVMREPSEEYESLLISMDFNSFLKDEEGHLVYITKP
jgi:hypothetical protein